MRYAPWLTAVTLAGCAAGDPAACRLDRLAVAELADQMPIDCGAFSLDSDGGFDDARMKAAHDCVLDAVAQGRPFTLFYDVGDASRHLRGGFTGVLGGGKLHTRSYAYLGDSQGGHSDSRPVLTVQSCRTIQDSGCTPASGKPCLDCVDAGAATTLCRF